MVSKVSLYTKLEAIMQLIKIEKILGKEYSFLTRIVYLNVLDKIFQ